MAAVPDRTLFVLLGTSMNRRGERAFVVRAAAAIAVTLLLPCARAQSPAWLREFGGFSDEYANALLRAEGGGVFATGGTLGSWLNPGLGSEDAFLVKFDDAGTLLWGVQFGTNATESAVALAPAKGGGLFIGGSTTGSYGAINSGGWDAWVARCDAAGNRLWVRQLGSTGWDFVMLGSVCPDGAGGVFVAGLTYGDLAGPGAGGSDVWLARYDPDGGLLWLRQFGTPSNDSPRGLLPDGAGGFFIGGTTSGDLFGPQAGEPDAWIARFDARGDTLWGRQLGTPLWDTGRALSADGVGGVFFAGATSGTMAGSEPGGTWITRYDLQGSQRSLMQFATGSNGGWPEAICQDGFGGAFVAGSTTGSLGGPSAGGNDAWTAHLPGGTSVAWIDQFGSSAYDSPSAVALAGPGSVFVAGSTLGNLAPGGGGNEDAWIARYDTCYADCNGDALLTVPDFGCFQAKFVAGDPYADCNGVGGLTIADFGCFQTKFVSGCP